MINTNELDLSSLYPAKKSLTHVDHVRKIITCPKQKLALIFLSVPEMKTTKKLLEIVFSMDLKEIGTRFH